MRTMNCLGYLGLHLPNPSLQSPVIPMATLGHHVITLGLCLAQRILPEGEKGGIVKSLCEVVKYKAWEMPSAMLSFSWERNETITEKQT